MTKAPDWIFPLRKPTGSPTSRLVVFPYGASGPTSLRPLLNRLPETVEVLGAALPGRERRFGEPPATTVAEIVSGIAEGLAAREELPTYLFGHSMGAGLAVAFALAHPGSCEGLVLSGRPPRSAGRSALQGFSDEEIVSFLARVGNTRPELVRDAFWRDRLLQLFRSDAALDLRTAEVIAGGVLRERLLVLGGSEDPDIDVSELGEWAELTTGGCTVEVFPGGHFFLLDTDTSQAVLDAIAGLVHAVSEPLPV
ncbi:alpha/beta fold hydrolase [Streptomyces sp. NPDC051742]|uniref:thioesterase II family protein n=1 Tax=unclassified Streptomyces TaxID=2593676 RepID=UPI0034415066